MKPPLTRQVVRTSPEIEALVRRTIDGTEGDYLTQTQMAVRAVKREFGMSPVDALNVVRMVRAGWDEEGADVRIPADHPIAKKLPKSEP